MATNTDPNKGPTSYKKGNVLAVDPNPPSDEIFTSEDLNISVELRTFRLRRSSISYNPEEERFTINNEGQSSIDQDTSVRFIRGDQELGDITTHYTELRTEFEGDQQDLNTLGITNIDIEFNESYAPLITIDFVDVRARLFEHGTNSPYNIFFDLPYPIFELTIKGFYGPPVTYCIHLTKFKSRFNADTGNFEIKTDFVGYTYAFLSDMLLGYVRAIGNTECGNEKLRNKSLSFDISNQEGSGQLSGTISIDDLLVRINNVNKFISKAKNEDSDIQQLALIKKTINKLEDVKDDLQNFVNNIIPNRVENPKEDEANYTIRLLGISGGVAFFRSLDEEVSEGDEQVQTTDNELGKLVNDLSPSYQNILNTINEVNNNISNEELEVDLDGYDSLRFYSKRTFDRVISTIQSDAKAKSDVSDGITEKINSFSQDSSSSGSVVAIIEVDGLIQRINNILSTLREEDGDKVREVSLKIADKIENDDVLGFKPTISNFIEIFANNVEAFVECIKETADSIEQKQQERKSKFKRLGLLKGRKLDFYRPDAEEDADVSNVNILPFPEYREKSGKGESYEERYIGEFVEEDLEETLFVDDLLNGILQSKRTGNNLTRQSRGKEEAWFPISSIDVKGLSSGYETNRWETVSNSDSVEKIIRLFGLRALTFLDSVSNETDTEADIRLIPGFNFDTGLNWWGSEGEFIDDKEVRAMGRLEARNAFNSIENENLKDTISQLNYVGDGISSENDDIDNVLLTGDESIDNGQFDSLFKAYGNSNGEVVNLLYHYDSSDVSATFFDNIIEGNDDYSNLLSSPVFRIPLEKSYGDYSNPNRLHLASYKGSKLNTDDIDKDVKIDGKVDLGETHIDIMTYGEYRSSIKSNYNPPSYLNTILSEENITVNSSIVNYNDIVNDQLVTDPKYRFMNPITGSEFFKFGDNQNDGSIDISVLFYETSLSALVDVFPVSTTTRGGIKRIASIDIENTSFIDFYGDFAKSSLQNRFLFEEREGNETEGEFDVGDLRQAVISHDSNPNIATIPYFGINTSEIVGEPSLFNIFGTYLYNRQESEESRAFLFLNTIPFRGINNIGGGLFRGNKEIYGANENNIILNLFKSRSSFLKAPYPWVLYFGSILWRSNYVDAGGNEVDPIKLTEDINQVESLLTPRPNNVDTVFENYYRSVAFDSNEKQKKSSYLYFNSNARGNPLSRSNNDVVKEGGVIEPLLLNLPVNVQNKLINEFKEWVNKSTTSSGMGWLYIKDKLEIFNTPVNIDDFVDFWKNLYNTTKTSKDYSDVESVLNNYDVNGSGGNKPKILKKDVIDNTYGGFIMSDIKSFDSDSVNIRGGDKLEELQNINEFTLTKSVQDIKDAVTEQNPESVVSKGVPFNFFVEMEDNTDVVEELYDNFLKQDRIIGNFNRRIWKNDDDTDDPTAEMNFMLGISDSITSFSDFPQNYSTSPSVPYAIQAQHYIEFKKAFIEEFKKLRKNERENKTNEGDKLKQQIFGSSDNEDIKLTIYKNVKNIYDKWIGGSNTVLDTCGTNFTEGDNQFTISRESDGERVSLIDSFIFLDRSYRDISDDLVINPVNIMDYLRNNFNKSFYNFLSRILSDNNMDFIPLPSFIDFSDPEQLETMFTPQPFNDAIDEGNRGPTFVCMYIGERSSSLDLGPNSDYENDGVDIYLEDSNNGQGKELAIKPETPDIGKDDEDSEGNPNENKRSMPVFLVNYGDRNQSIFKDFSLDQSEFTETNESLIVQEKISQRGSPTNEDLGGQNLYNVYNKRAYHCEIEAMGTAYIQPMMYFQLNNIPMFHGVYNIIKVNHSIQPHHMTTNFTGVRIGNVRTKIVDKETIFMNLVSSLSDIDVPSEVTINSSPSEIESKTQEELSNNESFSEGEDSSEEVFGDPIESDEGIVINSDIGGRDVTGGSDFHEGVDFDTEVGQNVLSIEDGQIERIKLEKGGFGLYIITSHVVNDVSYMALYAHLTNIDPSILDLNNLSDSEKNVLVNTGIALNKSVSRSQKIGEAGGASNDNITFKFSGGETKTYDKSGSSTGPHLHFEVRKAQNLSKSESGFFNDSNILDPKQMIASVRRDTKFNKGQSKDHKDENVT